MHKVNVCKKFYNARRLIRNDIDFNERECVVFGKGNKEIVVYFDARTKIHLQKKTNTSTYSLKENWEFVNYLDTGSITMNNVDEFQYINTKTDKLPSRARRKVKANSILYSAVRPNQLHYGIIKRHPENFWVSTGFTIIDVVENEAISDFVYYALTQAHQVEFLNFIKESKEYSPHYWMFDFFLEVGCCSGEGMGLLWENIDFRKKFIRIDHQLLYELDEEGKHRFQICPPKTHRLHRMAEAGMDQRTLQEIMGHSNLAITMKVYNHVDDKRMRDEIEKFDAKRDGKEKVS